LRIDRELWEDTLAPRLELQLSEEVLQPLRVSSPEANRYADLALPPAPDGVEPQAQGAAPLARLPVITGVGPQGQAMACLEMLALQYNLPFRRDVIEKATRDQIGDRPVSLYALGNLSTLMGMQGSLIDVAEAQLSRVPMPCVALIYGQPAVLHRIRRAQVYAVLPEYGRLTLPISDLTGGQGGASILTLSPGRDAQQRKLSLRWFLPQIRRYRRSFIEVLLASLILQLLNLANPLILQQIFDRVIGQRNLDTLYTLGFLLLGVALFQGLLGAVRTYQFADTTNRIDIHLGGQVIQHLLKLPLRYFDRRPVGELQTRIAELGNIRNFLTGNALTLLLDALFSVIYIGVMLTYSGILTVVSLGVVPLFLGLTVVASPLIRGQLRRAAECNASTQSLLVEALSGVQTIKAQNAENTVRWRWQRQYSTFMAESFRSLLIGVSAGTTGGFINQVSGLLTLWVGAFLVIKGELTVGQLIAFRIISGYVIGPLINLATSWQSYQGVALSLERLSDVLDSTPEGSGVDSQQLPLPPIAGDVTFQAVDFSFNEGSQLVVNNVSYHIPAGFFVGIVGRSGSGKSTIMKLLPRLYEPNAGRILIDGYDISKLQIGSVRSQIGIVPQDSLLFDGSVRDNITLTSPEATTEEIIHAARVACAHEFIMELPDGYSSRVGERGAGLSGGQRQRIAIARAVLQRPKLLILDEATSALDYITERQVCNNLKREFEGTTVFFITHRLSTIRNADRILMMDSGSLVEEGSHQELFDAKGRYYALYSQQEASLD
jgi:ATP-binding cassette subfamily B protein